MNYQVHRSVTFWSGILVMGFICWAWRDSRANLSEMIHRIGAIHNMPDGVLISHGVYGAPGFDFNHQPHQGAMMKLQRQLLPSAFFLRGKNQPLDYGWEADEPAPTQEVWLRNWMSGNDRSVRILFIPHWVLLVFVAMIWSALLVWRARRRKRISMP